MKSILNRRRLILGSKSPRRHQLLKELDLPFIQKSPDIEEIFPDEMPVEEVAEFLAKQKADFLTEKLKDKDVLLTSDSIVVCNGIIYGKPTNLEQAKEFIQTLSNNTHKVITGICIADKKRKLSFSETSEVKIGPIDEAEMDYYLKNYMPLDKAGAYGIQEWFGHARIEWIKGTYTNIMGLPTKAVYENLKKFCNQKHEV